jgi:hypothetical protein
MKIDSACNEEDTIEQKSFLEKHFQSKPHYASWAHAPLRRVRIGQLHCMTNLHLKPKSVEDLRTEYDVFFFFYLGVGL